MTTIYHRWIQSSLEETFVTGIRRYFPDDDVKLDMGMTYFPDDATGGLLPLLVIYIQIDGTEKVDGLYLVKPIPPSMATPEVIFAACEELATQSRERRGEIRNALVKEQHAGMGVPRPPEPV